MKRWEKSSRRGLAVFLALALCLNYTPSLTAYANEMPADELDDSEEEAYDLNIELPPADPEGEFTYPRPMDGFAEMLMTDYPKGEFVPDGTWSVEGTWEDGSLVMTIDPESGDAVVFEPSGEKAMVTVTYTYETEEKEPDKVSADKVKEETTAAEFVVETTEVVEETTEIADETTEEGEETTAAADETTEEGEESAEATEETSEEDGESEEAAEETSEEGEESEEAAEEASEEDKESEEAAEEASDEEEESEEAAEEASDRDEESEEAVEEAPAEEASEDEEEPDVAVNDAFDVATASNASKNESSHVSAPALVKDTGKTENKTADKAENKTEENAETGTMTWKVLFTARVNLLAVDDGDIETLRTAISDAKIGETIEVSKTIVINGEEELDLKGRNIKYTGTTSNTELGSIFHVKDGTFTLKNTVSGEKNRGGEIRGGIGTKVKWEEIVDRDKTNGEPAGGAVLVESGATFTMNGGTISENSATWGGGIAVARGGKLNIYGGTIKDNTATSANKDTLSGAADGKYGGGGGIFCAGTGLINPINGNISITGNKTETVNDLGGGGIFIESKGTMKIYNAVITSNNAGGQGGGVAGCLHGKVSNISPQTAAIYGNTANGTARVTRLNIIDHNDWWYGKSGVSAAQDYFCAGYSVVGKVSMNGGDAKWTGWKATDKNSGVSAVSGDPIVVEGVTGLSVGSGNDVAAKANSFIENNKVVTISGNSSSMHGGGIGCNGTLSFGEESFSYSNTQITLMATKTVMEDGVESGSKAGYTFYLYLVKEKEDSEETEKNLLATVESGTNGEINFSSLSSAVLFGEGKTSGEITATLSLVEELPSSKTPGMTYDTTEREIIINATRTDKKVSISTGSGGIDVTTHIFTDTLTGVTVSQGTASISGNEITLEGNANFTNEIKHGDLEVTKNVEEVFGDVPVSAENPRFGFTVKLEAKSSSASGSEGPGSANQEGETTYLYKSSGNDTIDYGTYGNGSYHFELGNGEKFTIQKIPAGVKYTVVEDENPWYTPSYKDTESGENVEGTGSIVETGNSLTVTNTRNVKSLAVKKIVDYDEKTSYAPNSEGDMFTIRVTLGDSDEEFANAIFADEILDDGSRRSAEYLGDGVYVIQLKADETATITGIPVGTEYSIAEDGVEVSEDSNVSTVGYTNRNEEMPTKVKLPADDVSFEVVNHYYQPKTIDVRVEKKWENADGREQKVDVQLYRRFVKDEKLIDEPVEEEGRVTLPENGQWSYIWENLPQFTGEYGEEIHYFVKEVSFGEVTSIPEDGVIWIEGTEVVKEDGPYKGEKEVEGAWIVSSETIGNETTITNRWIPASHTGNITIHKVDEITGLSLKGVEFTLKDSDGKIYPSKESATDEAGLITFENLPDNGTYTLTETKNPEDAYEGMYKDKTWTITVKRGVLLSVIREKDPASKDSAAVNNWNLVEQADESGSTITITNMPITGTIELYKTISGIGADVIPQDAEFIFNVWNRSDVEFVAASDMELEEDTDTSGDVDVKPVIVEGATPVAKLKVTNNGQSAKTPELRYGEYVITEESGAVDGLTWKGVNFKEGKPSSVEIGPSAVGHEDYIVVNVDENEKTYTFTAENSYEPVTDLTVNKVWVGDNEAVRPENISVQLNRDGEAADVVVLNAANGWTHTWENLDTTHNWTVEEIDAPTGYVSSTPDWDGSTVTITNKRITGRIQIAKSSNITGEGSIPANAEFTFQVLNADGAVVAELVVRNGETAVTGDLPYGEYTVVETSGNVSGMRWNGVSFGEGQAPSTGNRATVDVSSEGETYTVSAVNYYEPITDLTVNKVWVGDNETVRPESVSVQLYRDGEAQGTAVLLNAENGWSYTWDNLDAGYRWEAREINVPEGYTSSSTQEGNMVTITNTRITTRLTVNKVWAGDSETVRPESVSVELLRDGEIWGTAVLLNAENGWSYTWDELEIDYSWTVREINVPESYTSSVGDVVNNAVTITNTRTPENPGNPPGGGGGGRRPPNPPTPNIPDEEVPLGEISDKKVPLGEAVNDVPIEILDSDVPLANIPRTGDDSHIWRLLTFFSGIGLALLALLKRKKEDRAE